LSLTVEHADADLGHGVSLTLTLNWAID
jgi:hypothetical protein